MTTSSNKTYLSDEGLSVADKRRLDSERHRLLRMIANMQRKVRNIEKMLKLPAVR